MESVFVLELFPERSERCLDIIGKMIDKIRKAFKSNNVFYTSHARKEMREEEFGPISEEEVFEAITRGKIIEEYPDDQPYPSVLIFGRADDNRPIHIVCAYSQAERLTIVITGYEPDPKYWAGFERRQK